MDIFGIFFLSLFIAIGLATICPIIKNEEKFMSKIDLKSLKKNYGVDLGKEISGVWFKSSVIDGLEFKIAKSGNPAYEKLVRKLYKPYLKQVRKGSDLPDSVTNEISNQLILDALLLDWKGMPGEDGVEVPFSKAEAKVLLEDKELKELKAEILEFADDGARFKIEYEEELIED
jgi:hypothetical protein